MCNPFSLIGSCIASCCCSAFSSAFGEANPFLGHLLIFFITCIFAMIMKFLVESDIKYPYTDMEVCSTAGCVGNGVVFRVSFALTVFYALHAGFSAIPGCSKFHSWGLFLKFLLLTGGIILTFWIENPFFEGYGDYARVGSAVWLLLQTALMVVWAYDLNDGIVNRADLSEVKECCGAPWTIGALFIFCLVATILEFAGLALAIDQFGGDECHRNNTLIAISIILGVIIIAGSLLVEKASILCTTIIGCYTTYLLFTALYADPDQTCNKQYREDNNVYIWIGIVISTIVLCYGAMSFEGQTIIEDARIEEELNTSPKKKKKEENLLDAAEKQAEKDRQESDEENRMDAAERQVESNRTVHWEVVKFHVAMSLASTYVCMLFTGWGALTDESNAFEHSNVTVWVNIFTQWTTFFLYFWTLGAMHFYPERFPPYEEDEMV